MERLIKDSGIPYIGKVPENWKIVRNKNAFSLGKEIVGDAWERTQLLSLTTKGIKCAKIGNTSGKVPDSYATYQKVVPNNLVMCLFDLDVSAVFSGLSNVAGMISPAYKVLSIHEDYYAPFCQYWFSYIFDGRKFKFMAKNIRYSLTYDEFAALAIVAPIYSEQKKIADFLDRKCREVDELIALEEKMIEELKAYKQSVITETVTKGLNPDVPMKDSGIPYIGTIPKNWKIIRNKNVFSLGKEIVGDAWKTTQLLSLTTKGVKCIRMGGTSGKVPDSYATYQKVVPNNLVMCLFDLDVSAVFSGLSDIAGMISPAYKVLSIHENYFAPFYQYWFNYIFYGRKFKFLAKNIRYSLTYDEFAALAIIAPPYAEQRKIADFLDLKCKEVDDLISIKQSKIAELQDYKKSIIYEYATGKKDVPTL